MRRTLAVLNHTPPSRFLLLFSVKWKLCKNKKKIPAESAGCHGRFWDKNGWRRRRNAYERKTVIIFELQMSAVGTSSRPEGPTTGRLRTSSRSFSQKPTIKQSLRSLSLSTLVKFIHVLLIVPTSFLIFWLETLVQSLEKKTWFTSSMPTCWLHST